MYTRETRRNIEWMRTTAAAAHRHQHRTSMREMFDVDDDGCRCLPSLAKKPLFCCDDVIAVIVGTPNMVRVDHTEISAAF